MTNRHPDLDVLENLLSTHNWNYKNSKDHATWKAGRDQADEIQRQMNIICGLGLFNEAEELYANYQI